MIIYKSASALNSYLIQQKSLKKTIGFVPTMGALHKGHISLIYSAKKNSDITVASIFINPKQFNSPADFEKYPVTIEEDVNKLEAAGCDILFFPSIKEIYPNDHSNPHYDLGSLETILEGEFRPGHFQGVSQVVHRLLDIVVADEVYIGQKDYQQCMVIKKVIELAGLNTRIQIHPTIREENGLAMSSRNLRLTQKERSHAGKIYEVLNMIKKEIQPGPLQHLKQKAIKNLTDHGFKVDYIEVADADNLSLLNSWDGEMPLVVLAAAYINDVRLIDNLILE